MSSFTIGIDEINRMAEKMAQRSEWPIPQIKLGTDPIIADESCLAESDVDTCHVLYHGVNVKLSKCGGITPGFRTLKRAGELDMQTMVGCMVESTVGIAAAAQLSPQFSPLLNYADLDGAKLLADDVASGTKVEHGVIRLSDRAGNGVELKQTKVS